MFQTALFRRAFRARPHRWIAAPVWWVGLFGTVLGALYSAIELAAPGEARTVVLGAALCIGGIGVVLANWALGRSLGVLKGVAAGASRGKLKAAVREVALAADRSFWLSGLTWAAGALVLGGTVQSLRIALLGAAMAPIASL